MSFVEKSFKHKGHEVHEGWEIKFFLCVPFCTLCLIGFWSLKQKMEQP